MAQLRRELDLAKKPLGAERLPDFRLEHLDRDVAIVFDVVRQIHGRHAASAELALDAVAVGKCRHERRRRSLVTAIRHVGHARSF